jgi:ATP-dependent RNA helicase DeaD
MTNADPFVSSPAHINPSLASDAAPSSGSGLGSDVGSGFGDHSAHNAGESSERSGAHHDHSGAHGSSHNSGSHSGAGNGSGGNGAGGANGANGAGGNGKRRRRGGRGRGKGTGTPGNAAHANANAANRDQAHGSARERVHQTPHHAPGNDHLQADGTAHAAGHTTGQHAGNHNTPRERIANPAGAPDGKSKGDLRRRRQPGAAAAADVFDQSTTFADLGLRDSVLKGLEELGFIHPTRIQAQLIPPIMSGKDVLGQAKTGTGKTAAFALPLLHMCDGNTPQQAVVLSPTRELAQQIAREINELAIHTPVKAVAVIGGERINDQARKIKDGAHILVSTPGRLLDMQGRGMVRLDQVRFAVLDEVDRMLDIGFRDDIRRILSMCPPPGERQTIFVSATIPTDVEKLARSQSKDAQKVVAVTAGALTTSLVRQFYMPVKPWDRRRLLVHLLTHEESGLTVVFCRTKRTVDELTRYLNDHNIDAHAMHGDMYQSKRNKVIERLHAGDLSVLVASDLASRGLDVDGISHVINYDLPDDPEVYVHRIGRTARIGREGVAWSFVLPDQGELLTDIERLINMEIPLKEYGDFKPSSPPSGSRWELETKPRQAPPAKAVPERAAAFSKPAQSPSREQVLAQKFPGGIVPSKAPQKKLFGRSGGRGGR